MLHHQIARASAAPRRAVVRGLLHAPASTDHFTSVTPNAGQALGQVEAQCPSSSLVRSVTVAVSPPSNGGLMAPHVCGGAFAPRSVGFLRATQIALMPWPLIIRVLSSIGMVVIQSVWDAHKHEARKMAKESVSQATAESTPMAKEEAWKVLGLPYRQTGVSKSGKKKMDFELLETPLSPMDVEYEAAMVNFIKYYKATETQSPYLNGKFVAAYKVLIDPSFDREKAGDLSNIAGSSFDKKKKDAQQSQSTKKKNGEEEREQKEIHGAQAMTVEEALKVLAVENYARHVVAPSATSTNSSNVNGTNGNGDQNDGAAATASVVVEAAFPQRSNAAGTATAHFHRFYDAAMEGEPEARSPYLAGKYVAAYKLLVDPSYVDPAVDAEAE